MSDTKLAADRVPIEATKCLQQKNLVCVRCQAHVLAHSKKYHLSFMYKKELQLEAERAAYSTSYKKFANRRKAAQATIGSVAVRQDDMKTTKELFIRVMCDFCKQEVDKYHSLLPEYVMRRTDFCLNSKHAHNVWARSAAIAAFAKALHPLLELVIPVGGTGGYDVFRNFPEECPFRLIMAEEMRQQSINAVVQKLGTVWHPKFPESAIVAMNKTCSVQIPLYFFKRDFFTTYMWVDCITFSSCDPQKDNDEDEDDQKLPSDALQSDDMDKQWSAADKERCSQIVGLLGAAMKRMQQEDVKRKSTIKMWVMDSPIPSDKQQQCHSLYMLCIQQNWLHRDPKTGQALVDNLHLWTESVAANVLQDIDCMAERNIFRTTMQEAVGSSASISQFQPAELVSRAVGEDEKIRLHNFNSHGTNEYCHDLDKQPTVLVREFNGWLLNCYPPGTTKAFGVVKAEAKTSNGDEFNFRPFYVQTHGPRHAATKALAIPKFFIDDGVANWTAFSKNLQVQVLPRVHLYDRVHVLGSSA